MISLGQTPSEILRHGEGKGRFLKLNQNQAYKNLVQRIKVCPSPRGTLRHIHVLASPKGPWAVGGVAVAAGGLLWDRLGGTALSWVMHISAVIPPSEWDN